jgi:hypothetical protein
MGLVSCIPISPEVRSLVATGL